VTSDIEISRRALLRAMAAGSVAVGLAGCGATTVSGPPTIPGTSPTPSAPGPTPTITAPAASPTASAPSSPPPNLRAKAARMLIVGFRGLDIRRDDPISIALAGGLGGVILFDRAQTTGAPRNIASPQQLAALDASLRAAAPGPIFIAVDQEGGKVSRLNPGMGFPATRSQAAIGATGDPGEAHAAGRAMGATMAAAGIDLDLAPVVDVDVNPKNPAIGALGRSFSADPSIVAAMAEAEIRGLHQAGVRSAIKHFPGLGSAAANTDLAVVDVTRTWTAMELEPYKALVGAGLPDMIMIGNIVNKALDAVRPASLSAATVGDLLRVRLGWSGVVITDDLGAVAITKRFKRAEAVALAIEAGNDLLLFANQATYVPDLAAQLIDTITGLVRSGRITEARIDGSIARLDHLLSRPIGSGT
jgi:beta-N-acetylhexosaminidase